jgi:hypothetical protein
MTTGRRAGLCGHPLEFSDEKPSFSTGFRVRHGPVTHETLRALPRDSACALLSYIPVKRASTSERTAVQMWKVCLRQPLPPVGRRNQHVGSALWRLV